MNPVPVSRSRRAGRYRDPEVGNHRLAFVQQDVLRLDVPMDQPVGVRVIQSRGDLAHDADRFVDWELLLAGKFLPQRFTPNVRHDVEQEPGGFTRVVEGQDMRVIQRRGGLDLAAESFRPEDGAQFGPKDFDRHLAAMLQIVGQVDRRHAATAELALDGVAAPESSAETFQLVDEVHGALSLLFAARTRPSAASSAGSNRAGSSSIG